MQIGQVAKHIVGIGHILVQVIKVCQEQLSPAIKLIKGFCRACFLHITFVEFSHRCDGIRQCVRRIFS